MAFEERHRKFLNESLIFQFIPVLKDSFISFALTFQINLLHVINELFEFLLRQLFLLDGLPGLIGTDSPISLLYLLVQISQELLIALNNLVVRISKVKVQRI